MKKSNTIGPVPPTHPYPEIPPKKPRPVPVPKPPKEFKSESNSKVWAGKTESGEYVALNSSGSPRDIYQPEVVKDQNYLTNVGCWDPKLLPLTKKDKAFLNDAWIGQVEHCTECYDACFDTEDYHDAGDYKWTEDGLVCLECFDSYAEDHLDDYTDKSEQCIPLKVAESLESKGRLKFIERFIGGMVDGRGGWFNGESVREGHPKNVLEGLKAKHNDCEYVFSHDESGQFQTYFSVWKLIK